MAFMASFLKARMAGDAAGASAMAVPSLAGKIRVSTPNARITAYAAELVGSSDPAAFNFQFRLGFTGVQPGSAVTVETGQITWQGGLKVAALAEPAPQSLALTVGKDGKLYLNRGQDTALVGDLATLPKMFSPFGAGPGVQFGVGKDGWAVAATTLTGDKVLWVTRGGHPLLGVSQVNWSAAPAVTPLDLLFEAGAIDAAWAPTGKHVAVTVAQPSGNTDLMVWDPAAKQRFGPNLMNVIGMDYTVKQIRWESATVVAFDVTQGGKTTGPWRYDVISKALTKP
jgi:hypothetical protein